MAAKRTTAFIALLLFTAVLLGACTAKQTGQPTTAGGSAETSPGAASGTKGTLTVGAKDFTEQFLMGEMYALLLENAGYQVTRKFNISSAIPVIHDALRNGEIDLYPEYTGTALTSMLKQKSKDDESDYKAVKQAYQSQWQLTWLDTAPANNTYAVATTKAVADKYKLTSMSDLAKRAAELRFLAVGRFLVSPEDGLPGMVRVYGDFPFKAAKQVGYGVQYMALLRGEAEAVVVFGTDGEIKAHDLVVLKDDKHLWPSYYLAPIVRQSVLDKDAEIAQLLNRLSKIVTDDAMRSMNWEVTGNKKPYARVAKEFLRKEGLLK